MTLERRVALAAVVVAAAVLTGAAAGVGTPSRSVLEGRWHTICHDFSPHLGDAVSVSDPEMIVLHDGQPIFVATAHCYAYRDPF